MLHRRCARKFYECLNDVEDSYTLCFDIMENLVLPKLPIVQSYYSRQVYMYVFGIVRHRGRSMQQTRDDIHLYIWLEHQNRKDSNMVASALSDHFVSIGDILKTYKNLRLFSDSCYGQNKNINVVSMLFALRKQHFTKLNIHYMFPVRGHSFLPADSFEQEIREKTNILLPDEYVTILSRHGIVHVYGKEWECLDFNSEAAAFFKLQRSFKISDAKMIQIKSHKIGFKQVYGGDFCEHTILKHGQKWEHFKPAHMPMVNCVKPVKREDVLKLLSEIGAAENIVLFYEDAFKNIGQEKVGKQDLEDSEDDE